MRALPCLFVVTALACGSKPSADTGAGDEVGTGGVSSGDSAAESTTTASDETETTGDGDGDGDTIGDGDGDTGDGDTGNPTDPPPATGVQIVDVTADQGLRVPIAINGSYLPVSSRNSALIDSRPTIIRAFYEVDPGFATRDIYAVLTVEQPGGGAAEFESIKNVSEKSCVGNRYECHYASLPTGGFMWRVDAEHIQPGATYRIELMETSPGHENDVSPKIPVFPTDGSTMSIGVDTTYMKMRVVIVPYYHDVGGSCPEAPDLNEEYGVDVDGNVRTVAQYFGERLAAQNPTDEVEMTVHSTMNFGGSLQGSQLLSQLQSLRQQDNAPPGDYYYGVARPCNGNPDFAGIAQLGGPSVNESSSRVGWGVYYASVSSTAETFVHEIGHEQGRQHIRCTGEEAGTNNSYPDHPEGDTESYGMDVYTSPISLSPPTDHDYMTYCSSTWVSEWGWNRVWPWIEEISSWEGGDVAGDIERSRQPLLFAAIGADGTQRWWLGNGWFDAEDATEGYAIRYTGPAGSVETPAQWTRYHETEDYFLKVPVPADLDVLRELRWVSPHGERAVDIAAVERILTR